MSAQTQAERDAADCTVVTCRCGKAIFISVTSFIEPADKKDIGGMVAAGCSVSHMPATEARKVTFGQCACAKAKP